MTSQTQDAAAAHGPLMDQCPRFAKCSAPLCPLASNYARCGHLKGEPICLYLRERAKPAWKLRVAGALREELLSAIDRAYLDLMSRPATAIVGLGALQRELKRAAKSASKLAAIAMVNDPKATAA